MSQFLLLKEKGKKKWSEEMEKENRRKEIEIWRVGTDNLGAQEEKIKLRSYY